MTLGSSFKRRILERYPIYLTDEQHDNLDDDPQEPRNTTKTLLDELAAVCGEGNPFCDEFCNSEIAGRRPGSIPRDPEKRAKARIGKKFLKSKPFIIVPKNQRQINPEKGNVTAANDTGLQKAVPTTENKTESKVLTVNHTAERSNSSAGPTE